jgi:hypothetical protein
MVLVAQILLLGVGVGVGVGVAAVAVPRPALAQEIPWRIGLDARAGVLVEVDRQESKGPGGDRKFDRDRFEERVGMDAYGWAFRPEVFRFRVGGDFGLRQERFDLSEVGAQRNSGDVLEYDSILEMFSEMAFSLNLFASRFQDRSRQEFGSDQEITAETLGGTLRFQRPVFPFTLSRRHVRSLGKSREGARARREEVRDLWEFTGTHTSGFTRARIQLRDEDVDDRSVPELGNYRLRQVRGSFARSWGDYLEQSFHTAAAYFRRTGNFDRDTFSSTTDYEWGITDDLTGNLRYEYDRFDTLGGATATQIGDLGFRYLFYDSLQSSVRLYAQRSSLPDGLQKLIGGSFLSRYRKQFYWSSLIRAGFRYRHEIGDSDASQIFVSGEELLVDEFTGNTLENRSIDLQSIVVNDPNGNPLVKGIDYEVVEIGEHVSIEILPGSLVIPPSTLSVDYSYDAIVDVRLRRRSWGYNLSWDHGWLLLRYDHGESSEDALDGEPRGILLDTRRDLYGITLRRRAGAVRGSMVVLFERERSQIVSRDEWTLTQNLLAEITSRVTFKMSFRAASTDLKKQDRRTRTVSANSALRWRPSRGTTVRLVGRYRRLDDSLATDQVEMLFGLEGDFDFGRLQLVPSLRWHLRDQDPTRVTNLNAIFRVVWAL